MGDSDSDNASHITADSHYISEWEDDLDEVYNYNFLIVHSLLTSANFRSYVSLPPSAHRLSWIRRYFIANRAARLITRHFRRFCQQWRLVAARQWARFSHVILRLVRDRSGRAL